MPHISRFSILALNDYFSYENCTVNTLARDLMILYGDNGSGKTTILQLIFHLISSKGGAGHLNAISKVPFKELKVVLTDETVISAQRETEDLNGLPIVFQVTPRDGDTIEYRFVPEKQKDRYFQEMFEKEYQRFAAQKRENKWNIRRMFSLMNDGAAPFLANSDDGAHKKYIGALKSLGITCYFMATDRRVKSDSIEERQIGGRLAAEIGEDTDDVIARVRTQYLKSALASASGYLYKQVIGASNAGSKNTNEIYVELIRRLAQENLQSVGDGDGDGLDEGTARLKELGPRNERFSKLGLVPKLELETLMPAIAQAAHPNRAVLGKILRPYIDGLDARLIALEPIGDSIETFLKILNDLFELKSVTFSPQHGFTVLGPSNEVLKVDQLSSGEQQLFLMFCHLLVSNENNSIFMIDEPEISLNVKWQRELIDAMRLITRGTGNQIIVATHSIELLTQFSDMVVELSPTISKKKASEDGHTKEDD